MCPVCVCVREREREREREVDLIIVAEQDSRRIQKGDWTERGRERERERDWGCFWAFGNSLEKERRRR